MLDSRFWIPRMMGLPLYRGYEPLSAPSRQIRLLKLWRSSQDRSQLQATLQVEDLQENEDESQQTQYCALSWYWGYLGRTKPLTLNGEVMHIRENLYSCLLSLADRLGEIRLWVDAICINQSDDKEKSVQVAMMAGIYRSAAFVIAWLGDGDADTDLLFKSLENSDQIDFPPRLVEDLCQSFSVLFSRPYWKRLWTLQERAVATQLWMACGDQIALWEKLKEMFVKVRGRSTQTYLPGVGFKSHLDEMGLPLHLDGVGFESNLKRMRLPLRFDGPNERPLSELIKRFGKMECRDLRDKAYAIRALASNGEDLLVDYSRPIIHVFFDIFLLTSLSIKLPSDVSATRVWRGQDAMQFLEERMLPRDALIPQKFPMIVAARELVDSFPLTEQDVLTVLTSSAPPGLDLRKPPLEETARLCYWLTGAECLSAARGYRLEEVEGRPHHVRFMHRPFQRPLSLNIKDLVFFLDSAPTVLCTVAAIFRPKPGTSSVQFVSLAFAEPAHDWSEYNLSVTAQRTLEQLWSKGHIYPCAITAGTTENKPRIYAIRLHFTKLALLVHIALGLDIDRNNSLHSAPRSSLIAYRLPDYFTKAIEEATVVDSYAPCQCSKEFQHPAIVHLDPPNVDKSSTRASAG